MARRNSPSEKPQKNKPAFQPPEAPTQQKPFSWPKVNPADIPEVTRGHEGSDISGLNRK
jgi:hypothetical protein